ncbi:transporter substrate-binding domain-containing protein [Brevibacillus massiliensis]|uniref:transporter substrate-binding domain-containing protein n=1 Tax=Brevibacillus massiliensis TaxID=1118054 RepID=UPI0002F9E817|nr:transporter substrate-binding domain-containing protein [Brevibacillus massiliensis]
MKVVYKPILFILFAALAVAGCGTVSTTATTNPGHPQAASGDKPAASKDAGTKAGEVLARVKQTGVLKVGFEGTYPPYNMVNDKNEFDGFDVDISNEVAKRLGVKAEFVATKFDGLIGGLKADKFDAIIAQMSITDERKKSVDFTEPYVTNGAVIVVRESESEIRSLDDLKGKTVGAGAGTTFLDLANTIENAKVKVYSTTDAVITDLVNQRLDAVIQDQLWIGYNQTTQKIPVKMVGDVLYIDVMGMAVKKENQDFLEAMNQALKDMRQDGTHAKIYKKWFGIEPDPKYFQ